MHLQSPPDILRPKPSASIAEIKKTVDELIAEPPRPGRSAKPSLEALLEVPSQDSCGSMVRSSSRLGSSHSSILESLGSPPPAPASKPSSASISVPASKLFDKKIGDIGSVPKGPVSAKPITSPVVLTGNESWEEFRLKMKDLERRYDVDSKHLQSAEKTLQETKSRVSMMVSETLPDTSRQSVADPLMKVSGSTMIFHNPLIDPERCSQKTSPSDVLPPETIGKRDRSRASASENRSVLGSVSLRSRVEIIDDGSLKRKPKKSGWASLLSDTKRHIKDIASTVQGVAETALKVLDERESTKQKARDKIKERLEAVDGTMFDSQDEKSSSRSPSSSVLPKKKPDFVYTPFQKPEVNKISLRRIAQWEQLLDGVLNAELSIEKDEIRRYEPERPIRKISMSKKQVIADMLARRVEKDEEEDFRSKMKAAGTQKLKKKKPIPVAVSVTRKRVDTIILDTLDEKISKAREAGTQESRLFDSANFGDSTSSSASFDVPRRKKSCADIEVLIDAALEDAPEITEFVIDNHPFFQAFAIGDSQRIAITKLLSEALSLNSYYEVISCANCALDDSFLDSFLEFFRRGSFSRLRTLNLSYNLFTNAALINFFSFLSEVSECALTEINFSNQADPFSHEVQKSAAWALRANMNIIKLDMGPMEDVDSRTLIKKCIQRNLDLASGSGKARKEIIYSAIEERIRRIISNRESGADGEDFEVENDFTFKALPKNTKLALAKGLKTNSNLLLLRLAHCDLDDEFAVALASSLVANDTLEILNLEGNCITETGILALSEALKVNTTLKHVMLSNQAEFQERPFDFAYGAKIVSNLEENTCLLKFSIDLFDEAVRGALDTILNSNCLRQLQQWDVIEE